MEKAMFYARSGRQRFSYNFDSRKQSGVRATLKVEVNQGRARKLCRIRLHFFALVQNMEKVMFYARSGLWCFRNIRDAKDARDCASMEGEQEGQKETPRIYFYTLVQCPPPQLTHRVSKTGCLLTLWDPFFRNIRDAKDAVDCASMQELEGIDGKLLESTCILRNTRDAKDAVDCASMQELENYMGKLLESTFILRNISLCVNGETEENFRDAKDAADCASMEKQKIRSETPGDTKDCASMQELEGYMEIRNSWNEFLSLG
ncbi:hypothetical protein Bbelb_170070 [Branchiostoma belcheri]|nr:hypothetical protein Bbelb_170070 [Branchiostoma belcheri]